ncbi:MAG: enoyl-CoA hydratase [Betaproteobacteria bacterium]|nr:enoyl-CoA hydratase [Betaproteobacteria bacterium]
MNAPVQPGRILSKKENGIGWIIFSNLAKHNAVSLDMWQSVPSLMQTYEADPEVRAIVITGDGEKAFISGADISQFDKVRGSADAQAVYNTAVDKGYESPVLCAKPVIAKIRGFCMGGGLGLAAACDVRLCAEDAVFRMPAARLGLGYNYSGMKRFVGIIGSANTADIFFTARKFGAADALSMGFATHVYPVADFDARVNEYLAMVSENAPLTLAAAKYTIRQIATDAAERDMAGLKARIAKCFDSDDYKEGRKAFMEKRSPQFKGS